VIAIACKQSKDFEEKMNGTAASGSGAGGLTGIGHLTRDATCEFYSRLISVANSDITAQEMYYVATELWKRFVHLKQAGRHV